MTDIYDTDEGLFPNIEKPEPCTVRARRYGCTCHMQSVNSASIDPPEPIINKWCPLHGWGGDPDEAYECQRDDPPEQFWEDLD